jgi:prepilin-type N-terminal cleavage/methylation domain-containing protein
MMLRFSQSHSHRGFTLVEAAIAMVIVSLGALSTLGLLAFTRLHNEEEQERSRAHQMVSEEMERVRLELFSRVTTGNQVTVWDNDTADDTTDDTTGTMVVVMRDTAGNSIASSPDPAERVQVEVTLSWNPRGRRADRTLQESVMSYVVP